MTIACDPLPLVLGSLLGGWVGAFSVFCGRELVLGRLRHAEKARK